MSLPLHPDPEPVFRPPLPRAPLSPESREALAARVAAVAATGAPLPGALRAFAEEIADRRATPALLRAADALEAGENLETALRRARLSPHDRELLLATLRAPDAPNALANLARGRRVVADLRHRLLSTLAYSLYMLACAFGVVILLAHIVRSIGASLEVFDDWGVSWNGTRDAGNVSLLGGAHLLASFIVERLPILLLMAVGLPAVLLATLWAGRSRAEIAASLERFPGLGPVYRWTSQARLAELASLWLPAANGLAEALRNAARGVRNPNLAETARSVADRLDLGVPAAEALDEAPDWHPLLRRALLEIRDPAEAAADLALAAETLDRVAEARSRSVLSSLAILVLLFCLVLLIGSGLLVFTFVGRVLSLFSGLGFSGSPIFFLFDLAELPIVREIVGFFTRTGN